MLLFPSWPVRAHTHISHISGCVPRHWRDRTGGPCWCWCSCLGSKCSTAREVCAGEWLAVTSGPACSGGGIVINFLVRASINKLCQGVKELLSCMVLSCRPACAGSYCACKHVAAGWWTALSTEWEIRCVMRRGTNMHCGCWNRCQGMCLVRIASSQVRLFRRPGV